MPRLALLATGGTIAGTGSPGRYTAATLGAEVLLDAVPALRELATWQIEQPFALDSRDLQPTHWLQLAARIQALQTDPQIDGVVLTHGTDTLEETAFALDLLLPTGKPVVLTAAMRPADGLSADGPLNLLQASCAALAASSAHRGVLIASNDRLHAARFLAKTHTHAPDALTATLAGPEGLVIDRLVRYLRPAPAPRPAWLPWPDVTLLPRVDLITVCAGMSGDLLDASITGGARGVILALPGHGSIPANWHTAIAHACAAGIAVVRASRIGAGVIHNHNADDSAADILAAGFLNPIQARVLLMLALAAQVPETRIAELYATL